NALLHCYAELGHLARSKQIFDSFPEYNVASWTTMLQAYALSGHLEEAKSLFDQMPELTLQSWTNDVCFLAALIACGYGGLVHRGWQLFASLSGDFGLSARPEHYSAMVGLLARAGELDRAEELSVTMPFEAHGPVWR
ncbi:hypothetical protein SELMODRAFT_72476, partial [Selaginella moellendorffii]